MWGRVRRFAAAFVAMLALVGAPAEATHGDARSACHANGGIAPEQVTSAAQLSDFDWICNNREFGAVGRRSWMRFDNIPTIEESRPTHFVTQVSHFKRLSILVVGSDGGITRHSWAMDDVKMFVNGSNFAIPLPAVPEGATVLVSFERPWGVSLMSEAKLEHASGPEEALGWSPRVMIMLAVLVGLLLAPVIYNYAFYLVLRERFILWHIAMVVGMNAYLIVSSGIIHRFATLSISTLTFLNQFTFLATTAAGAAFCVNFIEPHAMSRRMREAIASAGVATLLFGIYTCLPIEAIRPFGNKLYYLSFLPIIAVFVTGMVHAARRHSRAVWFQIYGWAPIIAVGIERIVRGLGAYSAPDWVDQLIYLTLAFEIVLTALGVVDRFDVLRRDRDKAEARIDSLASLVDRDALTGLFNRRALEARYPDLRADGYTALAVIDLDHFKRVNDRYGHAMGDRVLQETAAALSSDPDVISYRLGGEEFLMLMRGPDVAERAERMRRAISIRIVNEIDGIDAPVTASLGLVDTTPGVATTLRRVYAHADRLLYEAKNSGRNRMLSERVQLFDAPPKGRRGGERRAGERRAAGAES